LQFKNGGRKGGGGFPVTFFVSTFVQYFSKNVEKGILLLLTLHFRQGGIP
jgi:hypothetical protein